jgi:transcription factor TFIIIB component B''
MADRSNSIPVVNPTSSRIYLRPPLVSSSSNNFNSPSRAVTETRDFQAPISSVSTSTIDSTWSISSAVDSQANQSSIQTTTVQPANVAASNSSTLTASLSNEEDVSTSQKHPNKSQSKVLQGTRKRKASDEYGGDGTARDESPRSKQRRMRASSSTPRPRKRVPSPLPYDPDADPGEDIDPTSVTMAALCTDTGQGRVSRKAAEILTNHAAWKAKNKEKRAHMRTLMELKKYGREEAESEHDQDGDAQAQPVEDATSTSIPGTSNAPASAPVLDDTGNGFDYSQGLATSRYNVQVRIGPNGETVIDEESLVVDRVENDGTDDYTHIIESDHTKFVNSGTYGRRYRGSRWSAEETELFYDVRFDTATYMNHAP